MADEENTSLLDDLAEAWNDAEDETGAVEDIDQTPEPEPQPIPEAAVEDSPPPSDDPTPPIPDVEGALDAQTPPADEQSLDTAPKGLSPAAREAWGDTPTAIREAIAKREQDYANGIQKYAQDAKRASQMDDVLRPFQNLFSMNGGPANVLPGLLQTAQALQTGSEHMRAQTVANLIQQFGVPVGVLADALEGKTPAQQQQPQPVNIQEEIQRALAPIFQQQSAQSAHEVQNELQAFAADPNNEFYADVRSDMADILDVAAMNGQNLTLQQAYDKACAMRDDIRSIIQGRASTSEVASRRTAASSISGAPRGHEAPPQPESISDYIGQAWDEVANRS